MDNYEKTEIRKGRTSQGVRGLKLPSKGYGLKSPGCRTSQGVRGLKPDSKISDLKPSRRTSQGVRGLKPIQFFVCLVHCCRTSQGVRGLKRTGWNNAYNVSLVAPRRGCVD